VTIHDLEFVQYQAPYLTLRVRCSKGTYIRVLGEDIGTELGCGAHLQALRRTAVGTLSLHDAVTFDQLSVADEASRSSLLAPVDRLLSSFAEIRLDDELAARFLHGQRLSLEKAGVLMPCEEGRVRVYRASDGLLLGTALMKEFGVLAPERLVSMATE
jgi:tRNA pseudouridine55 synthase